MDEAHLVPERGVLTASSAAWDLAVRRAEVIGRLAELDEVSHRCADAAAAELGLSRRQVYVLLRRWRQGEGVVSDMLPGQSGGGRGREHLPEAVESPTTGHRAPKWSPVYPPKTPARRRQPVTRSDYSDLAFQQVNH